VRNPLTYTHARLRLPLLLAALAAAAAAPVRTLAAQVGTGTLVVRVRSSADSTPLAGAFVRSGRWAGTTDSAGVATLELPGGLASVLVSRPGYRSWNFEITIVVDAPQRVAATLEPSDPSPDGDTVRGTRGAAIAEGSSEISVISGRQVAQASQREPAALSRLVDDLPAARVQPLSGPLGAAELRLVGLPGRYTGVLVDGIPLFGVRPGAYRVVQLSPFEFEQAELLLGPATALYGPAAPGGALNLVPRRADRDTAQLAINQSSE
jgi:iron complex outermembrane receptor protein